GRGRVACPAHDRPRPCPLRLAERRSHTDRVWCQKRGPSAGALYPPKELACIGFNDCGRMVGDPETTKESNVRSARLLECGGSARYPRMAPRKHLAKNPQARRG